MLSYAAPKKNAECVFVGVRYSSHSRDWLRPGSKNWGYPIYLFMILLTLLLRWTLVNRTYGGHKNLYIYLFLPTIFGSIYYRPP